MLKCLLYFMGKMVNIILNIILILTCDIIFFVVSFHFFVTPPLFSWFFLFFLCDVFILSLFIALIFLFHSFLNIIIYFLFFFCVWLSNQIAKPFHFIFSIHIYNQTEVVETHFFVGFLLYIKFILIGIEFGNEN